MHTIDQARQNFELFKTVFDNYKATDMTESDTRSKVIDYLFTKILGWDEKNINREGYTQQGYYDYKFQIPGFHFVVEAKRNFKEFTLPQKNTLISINTLLQGNKEVIEQIRRYIFEENVQFGVITNGYQFIIGKFINSDGSDWKKNKCLVFNGLSDIESRFIEFYNCLSFFSVSDNSSFSFDEQVIEHGETILSYLTDREKELIRNTLSSALSPTLNSVFGEIYKYEVLDNKELIQECFIENKEIKKNQSEILRLFNDAPPDIEGVIPALNIDSISMQISTEIENYPASLKDVEPPKPIIIIGSKGSGKTTFINYLFKVQMADTFDEKRPFVYLDFRKYTKQDILNRKEIVYRDILNKLYEDYPKLELATYNVYKRIYLRDIKINDSTIWKEYKEKYNTDESYRRKYEEELSDFFKNAIMDVETHFCLLSEYLIRERRIRLCIIFDNADQLEPEVQRETFLFSGSMIKKAKCNVIISLREGYYYKWRHHSPFDAYEANVYHVSAPPYQEILQKRISYALKKLKLKGRTGGTFGKIPHLSIDNQSVVDFLESIQKTIFGVENSEMLQFLEQTTYPNIREGLEIFRHFLLSGHTNVSKYILRQHIDNKNRIPIPIWEFIKAVALDNRIYYNGEYSKIHNVFIPCKASTHHFTKIKILKFLSEFAITGARGERFIHINVIIDKFLSLGNKLDTLNKELQILLNQKLIETDTHISDTEHFNTITNELNIAISLKGYYYVHELINRFSYIDLVLQDTPIFDKQYFDAIRLSFPKARPDGYRDINDRFITAEKFINYLKARESIENAGTTDISNIVQGIITGGFYKDIGRS